MAYHLGIDVSKWQENVDWNRVRAAEVKFAFMKAMEGTWADTRFKDHWAGSKAAGLLRGVYHYYRDDEDARNQARKLHALLQSTGDLGELPPALDIEEFRNNTLTLSKIKTCLEELERLFGRTPIIYTRATIWNPRFGKVSWASRYPLWVAHYTIAGWTDDHIRRTANDTHPSLPSPWSNWDVWQISDKAPASNYGVSGNTVDLDFATEESLERLSGETIPAGIGVGTGTGTISPPTPTPSSDPFDTKALPTVTSTLCIQITAAGLNLRSNTNVSGNSPSGSIIGNAARNSIHQVLEVLRVDDRIWARIGTNKWAVVEKRDGTVYATFVHTGGTPTGTSTGTGTISPPAQPPTASSDPFDSKMLPAVTSNLCIKVLAGALNLRRTSETRNGLPSGPTSGALSKNAVKNVLEVIRIEDRIWVRVGTDQWAVVEKRDGTIYAEFVNV